MGWEEGRSTVVMLVSEVCLSDMVKCLILYAILGGSVTTYFLAEHSDVCPSGALGRRSLGAGSGISVLSGSLLTEVDDVANLVAVAAGFSLSRA